MKRRRHTETTLVSTFQEQFRLEAMKREQQRAGVLAWLFVCGFLFMQIFFRIVPPLDARDHHIPTILGGYTLLAAVYEFMVWNVFRYHVKRQRSIPERMKFGNAFFEVTMLSVALYVSASSFYSPVLVSFTPLVWVYFLFIVLSTLRLNFALSVFTGLVAAAEYFILSLLLLQRPNEPNLNLFFTSGSIFFGKAFLMAMGGAAAGYVAHQIKKSIQGSIESLEQQNQLIHLFGQQISREVVNEMLKQNGSLQSSLREVTVMFIDIRGFTSYAEKRTPQEVVAYQNAFFSIVIDVVNSHQGIINQFLGDGCMVTFGAPLVLDNPSENAVRAGLAILDQVERQVRELVLPPTKIGIGLHVGEAVTGNIGTDIRQQYSITGNVVILASRIEQLNKDFDSQMLVSEEVIRRLEKNGGVQADPIGLVHVKGREEEVFIYRLA